MNFNLGDDKIGYELVIMRFICVILLHIQIESEVRQALTMVKYQINHPGNFRDRKDQSTLLPSTLIILMQAASSIATEVINLLLIIEATNAKDALMNFISLGVISQIDDIYFTIIRNSKLKEALEAGHTPQISVTTKNLRESNSRSRAMWLWRKVYKLAKLMHAVYFYFLPMLVPVIAYHSPEIAFVQDEIDKLTE